MKIIRVAAIALVSLAALAYLSATAYMYFNQRNFQYDPVGTLIPLSDTALADAQTISIGDADTLVNGWYQPPAEGKPLILFYKGNTGSFSEEYERYETWVEAGYGFLAFDYRGFPASPGEINQTNILADSLAVYDWAAAKGDPIMVWGRSIGTGPANYVSSLRQPKALLLETPFLSAVTVAAEWYPILPVALVMQDKYPSNEWIRTVSAPVLVAHGTADKTIDVSNGERLYALAPNPDELWIVPGADHSDLWAAGIWGQAEPFFERALTK
ncbi:alpha/beta hydrolase [Devosia sp. MC532]|uniref:alpha/beta hydrolase n=1 Tax=Devosia sp. MC532 TaxID=2799788 RepID=UPI0018F57F83|nr:alpha/beta hydrolase [Devosia sp. MC532]MBJ7578321.1 alpha/beta hydrolase [Devosia sp. MC532]